MAGCRRVTSYFSRDGREWRTPPTQVTASDQQALGYKGAVSGKRQARFVSEQALRRPALRHISRGDEILDRRHLHRSRAEQNSCR